MKEFRDKNGKVHLIGEPNPDTEKRRHRAETRNTVEKLKKSGAQDANFLGRVFNDPKEG